jgi:hypothetical protein
LRTDKSCAEDGQTQVDQISSVMPCRVARKYIQGTVVSYSSSIIGILVHEDQGSCSLQ